MDAIGPNVERERKARGWSKAQLAQLVDYATEAMIHQIEQGKKRPSYEQLQALAKVFGVTVSDLVGDKVPCGVTNNANGDNQTVYQQAGGGTRLMGDELQRSLRSIVQEELAVSREMLVEELRKVLREVAREIDAEPGPEGEA